MDAMRLLDRIGSRHRAVDPLLADRVDGSNEACRLLLAALEQADDDPLAAARLLVRYAGHEAGQWTGADELRADLLLAVAESQLAAALTGDLVALGAGFDILAEVLRVGPDRGPAVGGVLADYVEGLRTADACAAVPHLDWLADRDHSDNEFDQPGVQLAELAPAMLVECAERLLDRDPVQARAVYQTLLSRYPDHELADVARQGLEAAADQIEEKFIRELFSGPTTSPPRYCAEPAPYSSAPPYAGPGPHPLLSLGSDDFREAVPPQWRVRSYQDAVLVLCVDGPTSGERLRTCTYWHGEPANSLEPGVLLLVIPGQVSDLPQHTIDLLAADYDLRAYELHTGELVFDSPIEVRGDCPAVHYYFDLSPPQSLRVKTEEASIRSVLQPLTLP